MRPEIKYSPYPTEDHHAMVAALAILPHEKVLDVGGGHHPFGRADVVTDIDFDSGHHRDGNRISMDLSKLGYVQADMSALPFKDKIFDVVICIHVLEHTVDPAKACEELMRVAHRGFIETPRKWMEYYAGHPTHRWLVDDADGVLTFEPITFDCSPFCNFALPSLWRSPDVLGKSLTAHRHIVCVQMLWIERFGYQINGEWVISRQSEAERHYHFARNLLYWMAPAEHGLYHATCAVQQHPDNPAYSKLYAFYLARCGQWRMALRNGLNLRSALCAAASGTISWLLCRMVLWYRHLISPVSP